MTLYLNTSAQPPKYWEARLDENVLDLHEGVLGALGKGAQMTFSTPAAAAKELAKRAKAKRARGFVARPDDPPTLDVLLARYATHDVEAAHGDPGRALEKALAAMPPKGDAHPRDLARTALALASRGATREARAVRDVLAAAAEATLADDGAARRAALAAVDLSLGDRDAARAWIDAALALSPAWREGQRGHGRHAPEGILGAETLLALGRDDDARSLFAAQGSDALAPLLAHRRLGWFDALVPTAALTGFMAVLFRLRRAGVASEKDLVEAVVALAAERDASAERWREIAIAFTEAGAPAISAAGVEVVAAALRDGVARWFSARSARQDAHAPWQVVATLATLGCDITDDLARAVTPTDRARAVGVIARMTHDPRARRVAADLARDLEGSIAEVPDADLADALAGAVDLGLTVSYETLVAAAARVDRYALGTLVATAFRQCLRADVNPQARRDLRVIGWHLLSLAPKHGLSTTALTARIGLAMAGDLAAYEILSDRIPPDGDVVRRDECALLAKHHRRSASLTTV